MLKNMTPHALTIMSGVVVVKLPPSGEVARISVIRELVGTVDDIGVFKNTFGETQGLPAAEKGVSLVVSAMVLDANRHRSDLFAPGELVRDAAGVVIGCKGLSK